MSPTPERPTALVAFATRKGSTAEVAQAIADSLAEDGIEVDLRPAADVDDLGEYDGVVLGGALYMGHWHPDARAFLRRHEIELRGHRLAVFALGPRTLEPKDVAASRAQLDHELARHPQLQPVSSAIFGGVVVPAHMHFPFSHLPAFDARDWDAIVTWAEEVGARFRETVSDRALAGR